VKSNYERDAAADPYRYHYSGARPALTLQASSAGSRSICPKSHRKIRKKDHLLLPKKRLKRTKGAKHCAATFAI
jgi:hypothetical protein